MLYRCSDQGEDEEEIEADGPEDAAREYVSRGDYHRETGAWTWLLHVRVVDPDGDAETMKVPMDPLAPECANGDERWDDHDLREVADSVRGNGGGITYRERCERCGLVMFVTTWGTDLQDGTQGHTLRRYETPDETEHRRLADEGAE